MYVLAYHNIGKIKKMQYASADFLTISQEVDHSSVFTHIKYVDDLPPLQIA